MKSRILASSKFFVLGNKRHLTASKPDTETLKSEECCPILTVISYMLWAYVQCSYHRTDSCVNLFVCWSSVKQPWILLVLHLLSFFLLLKR